MWRNRVDEVLKTEGWKSSEFARACEISESYLRKIRKGKYMPSEALINRIVNTLNQDRNKTRNYTVEDVFPGYTEKLKKEMVNR